MGKPNEKWWGYVQTVIQAYPERCKHPAVLTAAEKQEYDAVCEAISATKRLKDGEDRLKLLALVWQGYTMLDAADCCYIGLQTAHRWKKRFFFTVAENLDLCSK